MIMTTGGSSDRLYLPRVHPAVRVLGPAADREAAGPAGHRPGEGGPGGDGGPPPVRGAAVREGAGGHGGGGGGALREDTLGQHCGRHTAAGRCLSLQRVFLSLEFGGRLAVFPAPQIEEDTPLLPFSELNLRGA